MKYEYNGKIKSAWNLFRKVYRGSLSPIAFIIGDMLYEYALNLSSGNTEIISNHFILNYNKEDIAGDIGVTPESLRQPRKKYNKMTVWKELESVGFNFENGKKGKCSIIGIPISNTVESKHKIGKFYINKLGKDKANQFINNLVEKSKGTFNDTISRKWYEIDYKKQNINNYKIFDRDTEEVVKTKLSRQLLCLFAKNDIDTKTEGQKAFQLLWSMINYAKSYGNTNYFIVEKAISSLYKSKHKADLNQLYGWLKSQFDNEYFIIAAQQNGISKKDAEKSVIQKQIKKKLLREKEKTKIKAKVNDKQINSQNLTDPLEKDSELEELFYTEQFYHDTEDFIHMQILNDQLI